jgi:hypothetical protein
MNITNLQAQQAFNQEFNATEQDVIARFCIFLSAEKTQFDNTKSENFNLAETDAEIRENVREFLEARYKRGHGKRRN